VDLVGRPDRADDQGACLVWLWLRRGRMLSCPAVRAYGGPPRRRSALSSLAGIIN
jgi:hypothetical protein